MKIVHVSLDPDEDQPSLLKPLTAKNLFPPREKLIAFAKQQRARVASGEGRLNTLAHSSDSSDGSDEECSDVTEARRIAREVVESQGIVGAIAFFSMAGLVLNWTEVMNCDVPIVKTLLDPVLHPLAHLYVALVEEISGVEILEEGRGEGEEMEIPDDLGELREIKR